MDATKEFHINSESIDLSNRNLTEIHHLNKFPHLKKLNISNNLLTDGNFLQSLKSLSYIDASNNHFSKLILESSRLESINFRGNNISYIHMSPNSKLTKLNLRDNNLSNIDFLHNFPNLKTLNLRGNLITTLLPLKPLKKLNNLNIKHNNIQSIQPILQLPLRKKLFLSGNDIKDLHLLHKKIHYISNIDFNIPIKKPIFNLKSGQYNTPIVVAMTAPLGHEIYYSTDGSPPSRNAPKYHSPIILSKDSLQHIDINANKKTSPLHEGFSFTSAHIMGAVTISAVSFYNGRYSKPNVATYIIDERLKNLPTISITINPKDFFDDQDGIYVPGIDYRPHKHNTGNYYRRGKQFEIRAHIELFDKNKQLQFEQNIGIRINGSFTRRFPQKSLRLYARTKYGKSYFHTNIFHDLSYNKFKILVLRNAGDDYQSTFIRDGLMHELVKDLQVDVQAYKPVVVYINGEYWGIHNLREKFNRHYLEIKYHLNRDNIALLKVSKKTDVDFDIKEGTKADLDHYDHLLSIVGQNSFTKSNLNKINSMMDIDNFFHYVTYQVYFANTDSFSNNLMLWRKRTNFTPNAPYGHDGRWRWMLYDLDWGMGYGILKGKGNPISYNMFSHIYKLNKSTDLFTGLMKSKIMQQRFVAIFNHLLNTNFKTANVKQKIKELVTNIEAEIPYSIQRWDNIESVQKWHKNIEILYDFAERRPSILINQLEDFLLKL